MRVKDVRLRNDHWFGNVWKPIAQIRDERALKASQFIGMFHWSTETMLLPFLLNTPTTLFVCKTTTWAIRMCAERNDRGPRNETMSLVSMVTFAICFGELTFAVAIAMALLAISTLPSFIGAILFCCGLLIWTLIEYVIHRFVLHAIVTEQHGRHHARPQDAIDRIFWQLWLAFGLLYLMVGSVVLSGILVAYAWYLFVHYCVHHNPTILMVSLLRHHRDHHRFAHRNFGVTTKLWDRAFRTTLE